MTTAELQAWALQQRVLAKEQINNSVNDHYLKLKASGSIPVVTGPTTITLNSASDITLNTALKSSLSPLSVRPLLNIGQNDHAFSGPIYIGISPGQCVQDFNTDGNNKLGQFVNVAGLAWGGAAGWGWTGTTFMYSGGDHNFNFEVHGKMVGRTFAYGATANGYSEVDYVIKDDTTGGYAFGPLSLYSVSEGNYGDVQVNQNIDNSGQALLHNGHIYSVYLYVDGQATMNGAGAGAESDFHDSSNGLWFNSVDMLAC